MIQDDHITGTGSIRYVLGFSCHDGALVSVFQFNAEGVRLKHLDRQEIRLYQAIWGPDDPHAIPGKHREIVYTWDTHTNQYLRSGVSPMEEGSVWEPDER